MIRFAIKHKGVRTLAYLMSFSLIVTLASCSGDDTLDFSFQPDQDKIVAFYDTISVYSETVEVDSIFSRSSISYLGKFTDPFFGTTTCDFMAQLYCPYNLSFPDDAQRIDSAFLYMKYDGWFGDSATLMHVKVYEMTKPLLWDQAYYTNLNAADYLVGSKLLGSTAFTTGDMYSTVAERKLSTYSTYIKVPIDVSLGNRFLNDARNPLKSAAFATPEAFRDYFNGIYVTCDFGNGSIAYIDHSELELCYGTTKVSNTSGLRDSFVVEARYFPVNKEVKQVNRFDHSDMKRSFNPTNPADSLNYMYTPAGLYTRITLPDSVFENLGGNTINSLKLELNATQLSAWTYGMKPPSSLLLIRESDAKTFFRLNVMDDDLYSFLAEYNSSTKSYTFNLSYYAQKMVRELNDSTSTSFEPFTNMLLIPVTSVKNKDGETIRLDQLLTPAAVKVKAWNHPTANMKLEVVYSKGKHN